MPQILAIQGPDTGKTFNMDKSAIVGRGESATIRLSDPGVGSAHFKIFWRGNVFRLANTSMGGETLVNDKPARNVKIHHGDTIKVGETLLIFSEDDAFEVPEQLKQAEEAAFTSSMRIRKKFDPGTTLLGLLAKKTTKEGSRLPDLLALNEQIGSMHDLTDIFEVVLDFLFSTFPCDRGSVILFDGSRKIFKIGARRASRYTGGAKGTTSRAVLREVYRKRDSLILGDAQEDSRFESRRSVAEQHIRALMAVPMVHQDQFIGLIVVDSISKTDAFTENDLDILMAVGQQTAISVENVRLAEELQEKVLLEREVELAGEIQQRVLPKSLPRRSDIDVHGRMDPAKGVGGDYYDFFTSGDDLLIAVGDVSGKGVNAGLVMMMARSLLLPLAETLGSPRKIMHRLNAFLHRDTAANMFMSLVLLRWSPGKDEVVFCGAGHEHILRVPAGTTDVETHAVGGTALGILPLPEDQFPEKRIPFLPGDLLVLYSDGVTEALSKKGEFYDLKRLTRTLTEHAQLPVKTLLDNLRADIAAFAKGQAQSDDITLVAAKRL